MEIRNLIKSLIASVGLISLPLIFVVNETISPLLFMFAIFCALIVHLIHNKPIEIGIRESMMEDLPPIPPPNLKRATQPGLELQEEKPKKEKVLELKIKKANKFCDKCGVKTKGDSKFCFNCGNSLEE